MINEQYEWMKEWMSKTQLFELMKQKTDEERKQEGKGKDKLEEKKAEWGEEGREIKERMKVKKERWEEREPRRKVIQWIGLVGIQRLYRMVKKLYRNRFHQKQEQFT